MPSPTRTPAAGRSRTPRARRHSAAANARLRGRRHRLPVLVDPAEGGVVVVAGLRGGPAQDLPHAAGSVDG